MEKRLESPQIGVASTFYFACRNGDIDTVKQLLPTIPFDQLNQLEPNGSTALHAATFFGHLEIVRLLLHDYGCRRHQHNRHGHTAYEEAHADEMRQLYDRPHHINRFVGEDIEPTFQIGSSSKQKNETDNETDDEQHNHDERHNDDEVAKPNQRWIVGFATHKEIQLQLAGVNGVKTLLQSSRGRYIMKQYMKHSFGKKDLGYGAYEYSFVGNKLNQGEALKKLINAYVEHNDPDFNLCHSLLNEYIQDGKIEALLTLYTLETPFYKALSEHCSPLAFPLFIHLPELKQRYYQGISYRGITISVDELDKYRSALNNPGTVISTAKFSSTSVDQKVADEFATHYPTLSSDNIISVLLILNFPKPCDTAIDLGKIDQHQLPCISSYEKEHEVLVAPRTFFRVTQIETNPLNRQHLIYLENILGEQKTLMQTVTRFITGHFTKELRHCNLSQGSDSLTSQLPADIESVG